MSMQQKENHKKRIEHSQKKSAHHREILIYEEIKKICKCLYLLEKRDKRMEQTALTITDEVTGR